MITDQQLENAERGDPSRIEELVAEVRRLRKDYADLLNHPHSIEDVTQISELQTDLAAARAEVANREQQIADLSWQNQQLTRENEALRKEHGAAIELTSNDQQGSEHTVWLRAISAAQAVLDQK